MVQLLRSKMQQQQIDWHRAKVLELSSQGYSQVEIATNLQMDRSIISRDIAYLRQQAQENLFQLTARNGDSSLLSEFHCITQ
jgi:transcriptional regulator